jgi:hypothetical protein
VWSARVDHLAQYGANGGQHPQPRALVDLEPRLDQLQRLDGDALHHAGDRPGHEYVVQGALLLLLAPRPRGPSSGHPAAVALRAHGCCISMLFDHKSHNSDAPALCELQGSGNGYAR